MSHFSCSGFRVALLALFLIVGSATAQEKQYALSNFDVTVQMRPDGGYEVEESITYDFQQGTFSRAYRSVIRGDGGALQDVQVTSPDAAVDSVHIGETDGVRQVRWTFPPRSGPAQFDIRYALDEALYERGDRNVVALDVMADEAVVPTRDVDVRVVLPSSFELRPEQVALEPADGTVQREAGRLVATFHRDVVDEGDDYAIDVSFPKQVPGEFLPTGAQIFLAVLLVMLGGGAGGAAAWTWRGPRPDFTVRRPPTDVDLPSAVALLQNQDEQAFLAVLLDLVRRGHITLEHDREEHTLGTEEVVQLNVHPSWPDLSDFEQQFLGKLRNYETLDDFWSDTRTARREIMSTQRDGVIERGWMRDHTTRSVLLAGGAFAVLLGGFVAVVTGDSALRFFLLFAGLGAALGGFIAAIRRYTWTEEGARRATAVQSYLVYEKSEIERLRERRPARAAERLVEVLPWLLLHDEVSKSWIEETKDALADADEVPELPDGFVSLVGTDDGTSAPVAAFLPVVTVMGAVESSSAGGAAAGAAGAAGGGGAGATGVA